jgi:hypothetical protein
MKYRIELSGRGGEAVIGKVNRKFYDLFEGEDSELDIDDYVWNDEYFDENEDVEIPEDIRPFEPGDWYDCDDIAHEHGLSIDSAYITIYEGDEILVENGDVHLLEAGSTGLTLESADEIIPSETLADGEAYICINSYEKGFFFSYEFEADSFDISKLTLFVTNVDGWELIDGASYDGQDLEDLGELSTSGKGSDATLILVEKD